jgi:hypothetical protein
MDFIEVIFGFSPDGGSGATEALLLAIFISAICGWAMRRRLRQRFSSVLNRISTG